MTRLWYAVHRCDRILRTKLDHQLRSLSIALPGIPTPSLDNVEAVLANHPCECFRSVTPSGDPQHRVLDPRVVYVAAVDQLRIQDVSLGVEAEQSLITPEAHAVDRHLPPTDLGRSLPRLLHALVAALGMKHVQDAGPPRYQMRSDTPEQAIDLRLRFQQLKDAIGGNDQIEGTAQGKLGDIAEVHARFGRRYRCRLHLLQAARKHGLGQINAIDKATPCRQWEQHTTGTAAQFQDRGV